MKGRQRQQKKHTQRQVSRAPSTSPKEQERAEQKLVQAVNVPGAGSVALLTIYELKAVQKFCSKNSRTQTHTHTQQCISLASSKAEPGTEAGIKLKPLFDLSLVPLSNFKGVELESKSSADSEANVTAPIQPAAISSTGFAGLKSEWRALK